MVVIPEVTGGRVRWLAGRAIDPERVATVPVAARFPGPCSGWDGLAPLPAWAVVAEGLFDWLALAQWGLPACAALGTQGLERVASALRGCPRVFLAFDNDEAGRDGGEPGLGARLAPAPPPWPCPPASPTWRSLPTSSNGQAVFERLLTRAARAAP